MEKANWLLIAQKVGMQLMNTGCVRAKAEDWARREAIIEKSTNRILETEKMLKAAL